MEAQIRKLAEPWREMFAECFIPCSLHQIRVSGEHFTLGSAWLLAAMYERRLNVPLKLNGLLEAKRGRPCRESHSYWVIGTVAALLDEDVHGGYVTRSTGLPVAVDLEPREDLLRRTIDEIDRCRFVIRRYSLPADHQDHPFNNRFHLGEKSEAQAQREIEGAQRQLESALRTREQLAQFDDRFEVKEVGIVYQAKSAALHRIFRL